MRNICWALWLLGCIWAHIMRAWFPMSSLALVWHRHRSLACWRELRELFRREGIDLELPG
jgi:hypothetical protein